MYWDIAYSRITVNNVSYWFVMNHKIQTSNENEIAQNTRTNQRERRGICKESKANIELLLLLLPVLPERFDTNNRITCPISFASISFLVFLLRCRCRLSPFNAIVLCVFEIFLFWHLDTCEFHSFIDSFIHVYVSKTTRFRIDNNNNSGSYCCEYRKQLIGAG